MTKFEVGDVVDMMYGRGNLHRERTVGVVENVDLKYDGKPALTVNGLWGYADNAVLVRPKEFKPSDRVSLRVGVDGWHEQIGVVRDPEDCSLSQHLLDLGPVVFLAGDDTMHYWGYEKNATFLSRPEPPSDPAAWDKAVDTSKPAERPLVGPAPKADPRYITPFTSEGAEVIDGRGVSFFFVSGANDDEETDIAVFVANALNAAVKAAQ